jgi:hypothetical protein
MKKSYCLQSLFPLSQQRETEGFPLLSLEWYERISVIEIRGVSGKREDPPVILILREFHPLYRSSVLSTGMFFSLSLLSLV